MFYRLAQDYAAGKHHVRDHGNALIRHVTGELVRACRIIFHSSMWNVMARIAGVLLGDSDIPVSTIRGWHRIPANKAPQNAILFAYFSNGVNFRISLRNAGGKFCAWTTKISLLTG